MNVRGQSGQALAAVLAAMVVLFALAGALATGVTALVRQQTVVGAPPVDDLGAESVVNAAVGAVGAPGAPCPASLGVNGELSARVACRVVPFTVAGSGSIQLGGWNSGCSVTQLAGLSSGHFAIWLSGASAAYVDASGNGCGGAVGAICAGAGVGPTGQVILPDCAVGAGAYYLHANRLAGTITPSAVRYAPAAAFVRGNPPRYSFAAAPTALAVADLRGDGNDGMVVALADGSVASLLGRGDGTFTLSAPTRLPGDRSAIAVGRFNSDPFPDLAAIDVERNQVIIRLGSGDGTFPVSPTKSPITVGGNPVALVADDFDFELSTDLAVVNHDDATVTVLLGNGDGTFAEGMGSPIKLGLPNPGSIAGVAIGHTYYLAVAAPGGLSILASTDGARFQVAQTIDAAALGGAPVGVTSDRGAEFAVATNSPDRIALLVRSKGLWAISSTAPAGCAGARRLALADFFGDGRTDAAIGCADGTVAVLLGPAGGPLQPALASPYPVVSTAVDVAATRLSAGGFALAAGDGPGGAVAIDITNLNRMVTLVGASAGGGRYAEADLFVGASPAVQPSLRYEGGL